MSKQTQHWEKTRGLLFITLAIWFVFSIGIFFFGTEMQASSFKPFGYPLIILYDLSRITISIRNIDFLVCE